MDELLKVLAADELTILRLRALFEGRGYRRWHSARFEEYRFYLENQSFLRSERLITFTDLDGRLLALRPDVTLGVIRGAMPESGCRKLYYIENVYRPNATGRNFKEISQMGLECLGEVGPEETAQVVALARDALAAMDRPFRLVLSHVGYMAGLLTALRVPESRRAAIYEAIGAKNPHGLRAAAAAAGLEEKDRDLLVEAALLSGGAAETLTKARALCRSSEMEQAAAELEQAAAGADDSIRVDFSVRGDEDYYSGLLFCGYLEGCSRVVLSGGQYDNMVRRMGRRGGAIGFAVYLDEMFGG